MEIKITDMDHLGNGIGKVDNKIVFIPKSITGDICDVSIIKEKKNYAIGKIKNIINNSPDRKDAECPYYNICGGCNISNLDYNKQLLFKENKVKNIFKKYLNIDINPQVIGSNNIYGYRNKITYHFDNYLGLVSVFDKVIDIDKCLLVSDKVNELYKLIKENDLSNVRKIMIRECDNGLILSINGKMNIDNIKDKCLAIYMDNKCIIKKEDGYISINNLKYIISDKSFFQVNTSNINKLYDEIVRYGEFNKNDKVIDLYCGVGSITLYIANYVKEVLGIEIIEDAIRDAKKNAIINNITNTKFICGDVSNLIDDNIDCDTLIVDPPRVGLDKHSVEVINKRKIKKIIYVSCDPMTLVRDIALLNNYKMEKISIVDMFPETHHVESIVLLSLKK